MIQQLIIQTLLACASKSTSIETIDISEKDSRKENVTENTATEKEHIRPIPEEPKESQNPTDDPNAPGQDFQHKITAQTLALFLNYPDSPNFCADLCQAHIGTDGYQMATQISNCHYELPDDWNDIIQTCKDDDCTKTIGKVECRAVIQRYMRGRATFEGVKASIVDNSKIGRYQRQAQEEAIAIFAFQELADNLSQHNAPTELIDRCLQAKKEEGKHTRIILGVLKAEGGAAPVIEKPAINHMTLWELAVHNAKVGCIEETWSALLENYHLDRTAPTFALFQEIANDEINHAQLSWDIHQWVLTQLSLAQQQELQRIQREHLQELQELDCTEKTLRDQFVEHLSPLIAA